MINKIPNLTLEELKEILEEHSEFTNFEGFVQWFWAEFARQGGE